MKVILIKDIKNLGQKGEVVNVKKGYFRNFLQPQKAAIIADKSNLKWLEEFKKQLAKKQEKIKQQLTKQKEKLLEKLQVLKDKILNIKTKTTKEGKLYGSITESNIADIIKDNYKIEIDKTMISIKEHIKATGTYPVDIVFYKEKLISFKINVLSDEQNQ